MGKMHPVILKGYDKTSVKQAPFQVLDKNWTLLQELVFIIWKNYHKFPSENWVYMIFYVVDPYIFMAKGEGLIFLILLFIYFYSLFIYLFIILTRGPKNLSPSLTM